MRVRLIASEGRPFEFIHACHLACSVNRLVCSVMRLSFWSRLAGDPSEQRRSQNRNGGARVDGLVSSGVTRITSCSGGYVFSVELVELV